jgi:hypothetical protein
VLADRGTALAEGGLGGSYCTMVVEYTDDRCRSATRALEAEWPRARRDATTIVISAHDNSEQAKSIMSWRRLRRASRERKVASEINRLFLRSAISFAV